MLTPHALGLLSGVAAAAVLVPLAARAGDATLRADLEAVSRRTIFFGHQSVGYNLMDGVKELADREGVALRIVEAATTADLAHPTFAHGAVPENGDPARKLESFERALAAGPDVDVAVVKFCYVDVGARTDVAALFARYQAALARLQAAHPRTTFVHVTVPLTSVQGGLSSTVKRLLGRPPTAEANNARREELNALVRGAFAGKEPLFDLARVESTRPDGTAERFDWKGRPTPALVPAYTEDGGHLRGEGRLRAARELLSVLASAPVRGASAAR